MCLLGVTGFTGKSFTHEDSPGRELTKLKGTSGSQWKQEGVGGRRGGWRLLGFRTSGLALDCPLPGYRGCLSWQSKGPTKMAEVGVLTLLP